MTAKKGSKQNRREANTTAEADSELGEGYWNMAACTEMQRSLSAGHDASQLQAS